MSEQVQIVVTVDERTESLSATDIGGGLYRIDDIPFFIQGLSLGDVVRAGAIDEVLVFEGLHEKSGATTMHLSCRPGLTSDTGRELQRRLTEHGVHHEVRGSTFVAVNVPKGQDSSDVVVNCLDGIDGQIIHWVSSSGDDILPGVAIAPGSPAALQQANQPTAEERLLREGT